MNIYKIWGISLGVLIFIVALIIYFAVTSYSKNRVDYVKIGTVIILNGPSSSGKTSIIKAFQAINGETWLNIGIDNFFVGVLHPKIYLEDTPEHRKIMHGIVSVDKNGNKVFTLEIGVDGQKIIAGMHNAIAAYAHTGNNVIVDYIKYYPEWVNDLKTVLSGLNVIYVGVNAPLDVIEKREKERGTSPQGHARSHYDTVHKGFSYDLILNSNELTPEQAANKIIAYKLGTDADRLSLGTSTYAGARLVK